MDNKLSNGAALHFLYQLTLTPDERHVACAILQCRNEKTFLCNPRHDVVKMFNPTLTTSQIKTILKNLRRRKILVGVPRPPLHSNTGAIKYRANWYWFWYDLDKAETLNQIYSKAYYRDFVEGMIENAKILFSDLAASLRDPTHNTPYLQRKPDWQKPKIATEQELLVPMAIQEP